MIGAIVVFYKRRSEVAVLKAKSEQSRDQRGEAATGCFIASGENSSKLILETRTEKGFERLKDTALVF